jgi:hypothetical protein
MGLLTPKPRGTRARPALAAHFGTIGTLVTLYKYVRPERLEVIEKLEFRFTQPGALNDPFELHPRFEALISEAEVLANLAATPIDLGPMLREAYAMLPEEQRLRMPFESVASIVGSYMATDEARSTMSATILALFKLMRDGAPQLRERIYDALNNNVGILSLSEVPDDAVMWAHYADNHRGMVLGFDEQHAFFNRRRSQNDEFYFLRRVLYADVAPAPSMLALDGDAVFVTKGKQWAYEREWRMLAPLRDATRSLKVGEDVVYLYTFPSEALTAIVFGALATPTLEVRVRDALRSSPSLGHVHLSRAVLDLDNQRVRVSATHSLNAPRHR